LTSKLFGELGDLFVNKLFFKKCLLLVVKPLFKNLDLGLESFLASVFSFELPFLWMLFGVLKLATE